MSTEVAVADTSASARFEASLHAEEAAERDLLKSLVIAILVALPISIAIFLFMTAIAISDKTEWYVWIGLGVGLGVIGAVVARRARGRDAQCPQARRGRSRPRHLRHLIVADHRGVHDRFARDELAAHIALDDVAGRVEQPLAAAEEHGHDRDVQLVDQARVQVLLDRRRTPTEADVGTVGGRERLVQRGLDAVGDEVERGAALHLDRRARRGG